MELPQQVRSQMEFGNEEKEFLFFWPIWFKKRA